MPTIETLQKIPLSTAAMWDAAEETPTNCPGNRIDQTGNDIWGDIWGEICNESGGEASPGGEADAERQSNLLVESNLLIETAADPGIGMQRIKMQRMRMQRIREIQNALASGTYEVSACDLAARLMTQLLEK